MREAIPDKGTYLLEKFNETPLKRTYSGNRLKLFHRRNAVYVESEPEEKKGEVIERPSQGTAKDLRGEEVKRIAEDEDEGVNKRSEEEEKRIRVTTRGAKSRQEELERQKQRKKKAANLQRYIPAGQPFAIIVPERRG